MRYAIVLTVSVTADLTDETAAFAEADDLVTDVTHKLREQLDAYDDYMVDIACVEEQPV